MKIVSQSRRGGITQIEVQDSFFVVFKRHRWFCEKNRTIYEWKGKEWRAYDFENSSLIESIKVAKLFEWKNRSITESSSTSSIRKVR